jgi:hypothetical protein
MSLTYLLYLATRLSAEELMASIAALPDFGPEVHADDTYPEITGYWTAAPGAVVSTAGDHRGAPEDDDFWTPAR